MTVDDFTVGLEAAAALAIICTNARSAATSTRSHSPEDFFNISTTVWSGKIPVPSSRRPFGENQSTWLISTPPPFITRGFAIAKTQPQLWLPTIRARCESCIPAANTSDELADLESINTTTSRKNVIAASPNIESFQRHGKSPRTPTSGFPDRVSSFANSVFLSKK